VIARGSILVSTMRHNSAQSRISGEVGDEPQRVEKTGRKSAPQCRQADACRMIPYRVFVDGAACDIAVYSSSNAASIAVGAHRGRQIEVGGKSAIDAAEAWAKAAGDCRIKR